MGEWGIAISPQWHKPFGKALLAFPKNSRRSFV